MGMKREEISKIVGARRIFFNEESSFHSCDVIFSEASMSFYEIHSFITSSSMQVLWDSIFYDVTVALSSKLLRHVLETFIFINFRKYSSSLQAPDANNRWKYLLPISIEKELVYNDYNFIV